MYNTKPYIISHYSPAAFPYDPTIFDPFFTSKTVAFTNLAKGNSSGMYTKLLILFLKFYLYEILLISYIFTFRRFYVKLFELI